MTALFRSFPQIDFEYPAVELLFETRLDLRRTRLTDSSTTYEGTPFIKEGLSARIAKARLDRQKAGHGKAGHRKSVMMTAGKRVRKAAKNAGKRIRASLKKKPKRAPSFVYAPGTKILVPARGSISTTIASSSSTSSAVKWTPHEADAGITIQYSEPDGDLPFCTIAGLWAGKVFPLERISADSKSPESTLFFEEKKRRKMQRLGLAQGISSCLINKQLGGPGVGMVSVAESFSRLVALSDTLVLVEVPPAMAEQFEGLDCNITTLFPKKIDERLLVHKMANNNIF